MKKIQIIHDRKRCIGCNSCVSIAPQNWVMDEKEGKAILIGSKCNKDRFIGNAFECDREANERAAAACPVNIIKVEK